MTKFGFALKESERLIGVLSKEVNVLLLFFMLCKFRSKMYVPSRLYPKIRGQTSTGDKIKIIMFHSTEANTRKKNYYRLGKTTV